MDWELIYRRIAQDHCTSVDEVKQEMDEAIWAAFLDANASDEIAAMQDMVSRAGEVPTREEFLDFLLKQY